MESGLAQEMLFYLGWSSIILEESYLVQVGQGVLYVPISEWMI